MSSLRANAIRGDGDAAFDQIFRDRVAEIEQLAGSLDGIQEIILLALIKNFHETDNPCGIYILRMEKSL